jgi:uridine phosphorylase
MADYLQPTGPTAPDALLPADPGHALLLAQALLDAPRMSNHSHGLWGYHGETEAGRPLSIQSTGIGGPSTAIVVRELRELGAERAVRVGVCIPLDPELRAGEMIVAERALVADGTSAALGARGSVPADDALTERLIEAAGPEARAGTVASTDLYYDGYGCSGSRAATARDLESAALLALGRELGIPVAVILVTGVPSDERMIRAGGIASAALAAGGAQDPSPASGVETRA